MTVFFDLLTTLFVRTITLFKMIWRNDMMDTKWLELYQYLQEKTGGFLYEGNIEDNLNYKYNFIKSQFSTVYSGEDKNRNDWLEHEAFTAFFSDIIRRGSLSLNQLDTAYNILMSAKLCQLALAVINHFRTQLSNDEFSLKAGLIYQQLGDHEHARAMFEDGIKSNPNSYMCFNHLGFNHIYTGENAAAIEMFEQVIALAPELSGGYQNLAGCYYQDSEFKQAASYCEKVFTLDKTIVATYITAISAYLALKNTEQAERWIQLSIDNEITSMELVRLSGISAFQCQRYEEAIAAFNHYLSNTPDSYDVLHLRIKAQIGAHQWTVLEPDLKCLLAFDPHDCELLEQLFLTYYHTKQWLDAEYVLAELNKLSTHYSSTYRDQINEIRQQNSIAVSVIS